MTIPPPYDYLDPRSIATPPFLPPGTATAQPPPPMRRARMEQLAMPPPRRRPPPPLPAPPPEANVRELGQSPVIQDIHQERTRQREDPLGHYQRPPWWKQALGYAASSFRPTAGTDLPSRLIYGDPAMREMRAREETNRGLDAQQKAEQTAIDLGIAQGRERRATFDQGTQRMTADAASRRADVAGQVADIRAGELDFERNQPPEQPRAYKPGDYIPDSSAPGGYRQFPFEPPDPQRPFGVTGGTSVWNPETKQVDYFNPKTAAPEGPGKTPATGKVNIYHGRILDEFKNSMEKEANFLQPIMTDPQATPEEKSVALESYKRKASTEAIAYNQKAQTLRDAGFEIPELPQELLEPTWEEVAGEPNWWQEFWNITPSVDYQPRQTLPAPPALPAPAQAAPVPPQLGPSVKPEGMTEEEEEAWYLEQVR